MKLTENFSLSEFGNVPDHGIYPCFWLCHLILQPLRDRFGAVKITSGYRDPEHNRRIGGSDTSDHLFTINDEADRRGAVDINLLHQSVSGRYLAFDYLMREHSQHFSQLIWYTGTNHFHIGLANAGTESGRVLCKHADGYSQIKDISDLAKYDSRLM